MTDLNVALRVQAKFEDARRGLRDLKADLVEVSRAADQVGGSTSSIPAAPLDAAAQAAKDVAENTRSAAAATSEAADAQDRLSTATDNAATAEERRQRALAQGDPSLEQQERAVAFKQRQADAANESMEATDRERQALERLVATLDPAAHQSLQLATAQATLNTALEKGLISGEQHGRMMTMLQQRYAGVRVSAGQTVAAMRMLPAQLTDLTTSVISGMPIWLALLQQGGQVKDSFGGIAPALAAIRSAISPVALAFGGLAAAAGLLVTNLVLAERRAFATALAIQTTGNAAGVTAGRIEALAEQAARVSNIGERAAEDAAVAMVQAGRLGLPVIANLVEAVEGYAKVTSSSTETAAANLAKLFTNPAQAAKQLDDQFNFLSAAQRRHIALLVEQGRTEEAQLQLSRLLADHLGTVLPQNLGTLQRAWAAVGKAAGDAFSGLMRWGQTSTLEKQIEAQKAAIAGLESQIESAGDRALGRLPALLQAAQSRLEELTAKRATDEAKADQDSAKVTRERRVKLLREQFDAEAKTYETGTEQLKKAQANLKELLDIGPEAGGISQAEYDARLKAIRERASKSTPEGDRAAQIAAARIKSDLQLLQAQIRESDALVVKALNDGRMTINDAYASRTADIERDYAAQKEALEKELNASGTTAARRIEISAAIKILEQSKAAASRDIEAWRRAEELKIANITVRLRIDAAAITGKFDRAAIEEQLRQQYAGDIEAAGRMPDEEDARRNRATIQLLIQSTAAQAEFNNKLAEAQRLQTDLSILEEAIQQRAASGAISQIEAQAQINQARGAQLPMLRAIADQLQRIRDALPKEAKVAIDSMTASIGTLENQITAATPTVVEMGTRLRSTMIDGIADAAAMGVASFSNLRQAAATTLKQIAADIVRSSIKQLLTDAFTPGSAGGGGGGGSLVGSLISAGKSFFGFAEGGLIQGPGTGTSDSIPALVDGVQPIAVSNDEFIQPAKAVRHYGVGFMEKIRTLQLPKPAFALGGLVRAAKSAAGFASGGLVSAPAEQPAGQRVLIQFVNQGTPQRQVSQTEELSGRDLVVSVVLEDVQSGGPISRALPAVFNRGA